MKVKMSSPPKKRKRTPSFKIELSGDVNKKTSVLEKLQNIKGELEIKLNKHIGNVQVIEYLFSLWTDISKRSEEHNQSTQEKPAAPSPFIKFKRKMSTKKFSCVLKIL